uniref:Uncharacterized protein n=1 Tax=Glossina austeni TaxID=7395 RepID=A0A1A9VR73_GLOAU
MDPKPKLTENVQHEFLSDSPARGVGGQLKRNVKVENTAMSSCNSNVLDYLGCRDVNVDAIREDICDCERNDASFMKPSSGCITVLVAYNCNPSSSSPRPPRIVTPGRSSNKALRVPAGAYESIARLASTSAGVSLFNAASNSLAPGTPGTPDGCEKQSSDCEAKLSHDADLSFHPFKSVKVSKGLSACYL